MIARDARADGTFVYAVQSTGIYCRPTCPSRRPRRDRVTFHDSAAAAAHAGFRACRRCHPDGVAPADARATAIEQACRLLHDAEERPSLAALAASASLSPFHFHRLFKAATGVTPRAYFAAVRAQRATRTLRSAPRVTDAIYEAGFASNGRFHEAMAPRLGMTPTRFRAGGRGERIRFLVRPCSLGKILVAASPRGVCAISLGDSARTLEAQLRAQFPNADVARGGADFTAVVRQVLSMAESTTRAAARLPLDIRGTSFQQRVWQALRRIPYGETLTYGALAARLGMPRAVRAVASACARNPLALAIPCHRVVGADGAMRGYRWGIERKRQLLAREQDTSRRTVRETQAPDEQPRRTTGSAARRARRE